ncbi:MAG: amidohydrolase [Synergistaceae bacterium]|nr:amidohydrolase [Synergistaceae bacterium]
MYADNIIDKVIAWRRDIHANPELSQHEERTSGLVAGVLESLGLEVTRNVGGFGVVGLLRGKTPGKTIALRADMDALPLTEATGLDFASHTPGVMHACGHDTHTAMLLGTACVLSDMRESITGNVKFIFQPAEELNPTGGAPGMIRDGVLENPHVDALFALHVWPAYQTGRIAIRSGATMAASDRIFLTVRGKTAHGSRPDQGLDAILAAAHVITGLQGIISRNVSPLDSAVLTIGRIEGGYRYNVIPDCVKMEGTVRTLNPDVQENMPDWIRRMAQGIAGAFGAECECEYVKGYPPLVNDSVLAERARDSVRRRLGDSGLIVPEQPDLTAEDFAFFARERPAVMAWLGCRPEGVSPEDTAMLHNTKFCPDEECFRYGIEYLAGSAIDFLSK